MLLQYGLITEVELLQLQGVLFSQELLEFLQGGIAYAALYFFLARIVNLGGMGGERLFKFCYVFFGY